MQYKNTILFDICNTLLQDFLYCDKTGKRTNLEDHPFYLAYLAEKERIYVSEEKEKEKRDISTALSSDLRLN